MWENDKLVILVKKKNIFIYICELYVLFFCNGYYFLRMYELLNIEFYCLYLGFFLSIYKIK